MADFSKSNLPKLEQSFQKSVDGFTRSILETNNQLYRGIESVEQTRREKEEREKQGLKYQEETVSLLRETKIVLEGKLSDANHTLDLIINAMGANSQQIQSKVTDISKSLEQLKEILSDTSPEGKTKLNEFLEELLRTGGIEFFLLLIKKVMFPV